MRLGLIDQQAPARVGGYGSINHTLTSVRMAFLRKSKSDKVCMKLKEVGFVVGKM